MSDDSDTHRPLLHDVPVSQDAVNVADAAKPDVEVGRTCTTWMKESERDSALRYLTSGAVDTCFAALQPEWVAALPSEPHMRPSKVVGTARPSVRCVTPSCRRSGLASHHCLDCFTALSPTEKRTATLDAAAHVVPHAQAEATKRREAETKQRERSAAEEEARMEKRRRDVLEVKMTTRHEEQREAKRRATDTRRIDHAAMVNAARGRGECAVIRSKEWHFDDDEVVNLLWSGEETVVERWTCGVLNARRGGVDHELHQGADEVETLTRLNTTVDAITAALQGLYAHLSDDDDDTGGVQFGSYAGFFIHVTGTDHLEATMSTHNILESIFDDWSDGELVMSDFDCVDVPGGGAAIFPRPSDYRSGEDIESSAEDEGQMEVAAKLLWDVCAPGTGWKLAIPDEYDGNDGWLMCGARTKEGDVVGVAFGAHIME